MKLADIEQACKGNFVWDRAATIKIMQCNPEVESSPDTALIVFCGLSEMYGFEVKEVAPYLSIPKTEYFRLLRLFRLKMEAARRRRQKGEWDTEINDLVQKVYIKTRLLQNYLRLHSQGYFIMEDMPNA